MVFSYWCLLECGGRGNFMLVSSVFTHPMLNIDVLRQNVSVNIIWYMCFTCLPTSHIQVTGLRIDLMPAIYRFFYLLQLVGIFNLC